MASALRPPLPGLASVVILNHNGLAIQDVLRRSVQAVLAQDYVPHELILVDDQSTDGSADLLRTLAQEVGAEYTQTVGRKHGVSAARNAGLRLAQGEYIAFLDNDAVPQRGWLAALVQRMASDTTVAACASRVMFADKPDIVNSLGSVLNELFHGNGMCIHELFEFASSPEAIMYATGNGMLLRRGMVDRIGLFDEGYLFWGADDADYGMRLRRAGGRSVPVPEAVVHHLHSFSKTVAGMPFWDGRNRIRMALKHQSWRELPRFLWRDARYYILPGHLKDYVRYWWSTLTDGEGLRALGAYRWAHRGEPPYAAQFRDYFMPPRRLYVVPDNRAYGREYVPLRALRVGQNDEQYLYHGWYWVEHWGRTPMRWAMRVASLVGTLADGAQALHWRLLGRPGAERTLLTLRLRRRTERGYVEVTRQPLALHAPGAVPEEIVTPGPLPAGDYHLILEAAEARRESGFFPRQIGVGLAGLEVEP